MKTRTSGVRPYTIHSWPLLSDQAHHGNARLPSHRKCGLTAALMRAHPSARICAVYPNTVYPILDATASLKVPIPAKMEAYAMLGHPVPAIQHRVDGGPRTSEASPKNPGGTTVLTVGLGRSLRTPTPQLPHETARELAPIIKGNSSLTTSQVNCMARISGPSEIPLTCGHTRSSSLDITGEGGDSTGR